MTETRDPNAMLVADFLFDELSDEDVDRLLGAAIHERAVGSNQHLVRIKSPDWPFYRVVPTALIWALLGRRKARREIRRELEDFLNGGPGTERIVRALKQVRDEYAGHH